MLYEWWMLPVQLSYIAGFFDGEGSVSVSRPKATKNQKRYLKLRARIGQNTRAVLDWIQSLFGGSVIEEKKTYGSAKKVMYRWQASDRVAEKFLRTIEPYLIVKRMAVDVAVKEVYGNAL
jgi:hypothetical protein